MSAGRCLVCAFLITVGLALTACGEDSADSGTSDCTQVIRHEGRTYTEAGFSNHAGRRVGTIDVADCDDNGPGAVGVTFPPHPSTADAHLVHGFTGDEALAVREGEYYRVFVQDDVPESTRERVVREFG